VTDLMLLSNKPGETERETVDFGIYLGTTNNLIGSNEGPFLNKKSQASGCEMTTACNIGGFVILSDINGRCFSCLLRLRTLALPAGFSNHGS
jgi:hypothetical protein